jgi:hypothetical protein
LLKHLLNDPIYPNKYIDLSTTKTVQKAPFYGFTILTTDRPAHQEIKWNRSLGQQITLIKAATVKSRYTQPPERP